MLRVATFRPSHLRRLEPKPEQQAEYDYIVAADLKHFGNAFTVLMDGLCPLCCAFCIEIWPGRATIGAFFSKWAELRHMVWIHRKTMALIEKQPYRRLETTVRADYEGGHIWARKCGFTMDCVLKSYDPFGNDACLYSRVKS